ncbi:MAG: transglutaminase-like domain-containing protein, partial [Ruminococcus sp.]|nr:transglutaminase-like domain-containing protein [Ruminococcus sp.]
MAHHLRKMALAGLLACSAIVLGSIPIAKNTSMYQQASISAYAEETDPTLSVTDEATALTYWYVPTSKTTCTLRRITNKGDSWSLNGVTSVTIPDKIPTTNYVITEIGYAKEAIIHSKVLDKTVTAITLPSTLKRINHRAMYCTELPHLSTVSLYLDSLEYCAPDVFGGNKNWVQHINVYDSTVKKFVAVDTVEKIEKYFDIVYHIDADGNKVPTIYTATDKCSPEMTDCSFQLKDSSFDAKLQFVNALYGSPYCIAMASKYAQKIAAENNFTSSEFSAHTKLMMIYNYIHSHARYSRLYSTDNMAMDGLFGTSFGVLGAHSGVCGALSYAYESLCRASGLNVTDSPYDSDVMYAEFPGHAVAVVRLSPEDGYYVTDLADCQFMKGKCDGFVNLHGVGLYGTGEPGFVPTAVNRDATYDILSTNEYCPGYTLVKIKTETDHGLRVEGYNANKTNEKYFDYIAQPRTVLYQDYSCDDLCITDEIVLYVESDCDKTFRIGGVELDPKLEQQTVQVGTNKYQVTQKILDFGPTTWEKRSAESTFINLEIKQLPTIAAQPKN